MANDQKILDEFTKLLQSMSDNSDKSTKSMDKILSLSKQQVSQLKKMVKSGAGIEGIIDPEEVAKKAFKTQKDKEKYEDDMIKREEEFAKQKLDTLDDEMDAYAELFKGEEKLTTQRKKNNAVQVKEFGKATDSFKTMFGYVGQLTGLNAIFGLWSGLMGSIQSEFGALGDLVSNVIFAPLKGIGLVAGGLFKVFGMTGKQKDDASPTTASEKHGVSGLADVATKTMGLKTRTTEQAKDDESLKVQEEQSDYLKNIEKYLQPEKEVIKAGGLNLDWLKKLIPAGMMGAVPPMGGIGAKMMKIAGGAMILGGLVWMVSDFIEGFAEGGVAGGVSRALLGKTDGSISSAFKNAGKWALIGAGIGSFVPVIGTLAGGLIGGAIGLVLNYVGSLVKSDMNIGQKIGNVFLGGDGGVLASLFSGAKYAAMGALIGSVVPGPGTIAGGMIGFVVGFLINFIKQILPTDVKEGIMKVVSWAGKIITKTWDWWAGFFSELWVGIKGKMNIAGEYISDAATKIGDAFSWLGEKVMWLADKLGVKDFIVSAMAKVDSAWTAFKDATGEVFDWLGGFMSGIWDSFKTVISGYWDRIKVWFGGGTDKGSITGLEGTIKGGTAKPAKKKGGSMLESLLPTADSKHAPVGSGYGATSEINAPEYTTKAEKTTAKKNVEISKQAKKQTDKLGLIQTISDDMSNHLKIIREFIQGKMLDNFDGMFAKYTQLLYSNLKMMNEENRMYEYYGKTGSLEGYGAGYAKYATELQETMSKGKEQRDIKEAMTTMANVGNQTTNILAETPALKLMGLPD